jgi:hypothetical protein
MKYSRMVVVNFRRRCLESPRATGLESILGWVGLGRCFRRHYRLRTVARGHAVYVACSIRRTNFVPRPLAWDVRFFVATTHSGTGGPDWME